MLVVGVVGGIASGKSYVAGCFGQLGAVVLDADKIGHEVLRDPEVMTEICRRWGTGVRGTDQQVDRRKLAAIVFAPPPDGPRELAVLEQFTHPRIAAKLSAAIDHYRQTGKTPMVVLDAAVLLKSGWDTLCDQIVHVDVPRSIRWQRVQARGWTEEQFDQRERSQTPLEESRRRATCVIDNGGSAEATWAEVCRLWYLWTGITPATNA